MFPTIRRRFRNEAERKSGLDQIKGALQLGKELTSVLLPGFSAIVGTRGEIDVTVQQPVCLSSKLKLLQPRFRLCIRRLTSIDGADGNKMMFSFGFQSFCLL